MAPPNFRCRRSWREPARCKSAPGKGGARLVGSVASAVAMPRAKPHGSCRGAPQRNGGLRYAVHAAIIDQRRFRATRSWERSGHADAPMPAIWPNTIGAVVGLPPRAAHAVDAAGDFTGGVKLRVRRAPDIDHLRLRIDAQAARGEMPGRSMRNRVIAAVGERQHRRGQRPAEIAVAASGEKSSEAPGGLG